MAAHCAGAVLQYGLPTVTMFCLAEWLYMRAGAGAMGRREAPRGAALNLTIAPAPPAGALVEPVGSASPVGSYGVKLNDGIGSLARSCNPTWRSGQASAH